MIIAIEGVDGVGKTTISKLVADKLNFIFAEKPLHYLLDDRDKEYTNYIKLRDFFNNNEDRNLSAWFYGLNYMLISNIFKGKNIVTDRYLISMYALSFSDYNIDIYDLIVKKIELPFLTVILKASKEIVYNRLILRNPIDKDVYKLNNIDNFYKKSYECINRYNLNHIIIDTSNLDKETITNIIINKYFEMLEINR